MRIVRYQKNHHESYGILANDNIIPIIGDIFGDYTEGTPFPAKDTALLAPLIPKTLYAIGLNYRDHVGELDFAQQLPQEPISFIVSSQAVIGSEETIILNEKNCRIDEEAELVVIIGKPCFKVTAAEALDYVFGYTCGNDVSNRERQRQDGQWLRGKSYPTYKPLGPWIETELDPSNLAITGKVNGQIVQSSNTAHLLFSIPEIIAFLSSFTPLQPGDCIMTGTPQGVCALKDNDIVEITIENIGTLRNPVKAL